MNKMEKLDCEMNGMLGEYVTTQFHNGFTLDEIGRMIGIGRHLISKWCKLNNVIYKNVNISEWFSKNDIDNPVEWFNENYTKKCKSGYELADLIGVSDVAIYQYMRSKNIQRRSDKDARIAWLEHLDDESKQKYLLLNKTNKKKYYDSLSDSDKKIIGKKLSISLHNYWNNCGAEKHVSHSMATKVAARKRLASWSEDKKKECLSRLQNGKNQKLASMTSEEKKERIAKANKIFREKYNSDPEYKAQCIRHSLEAQNFKESKPEKAIKQALIDHGYGNFVAQYQLGFYSIDIAYPDIKLAIEIDGEYWHSLPKVVVKDKRKNSYILNYCKWDLVRVPATPCIKETEKMVWYLIECIENAKTQIDYSYGT